MNDDNNEKERERERELCEQKRKEEIRKQMRRIRDDDDPYKDDTDISGEEFFQLDAEYDVIQEIKQHTKAIRDNDDKDIEDIVDVGSSAPVNNDSNRNNNNHEEESDATQQYPKRTREQVINDKYILKQQQQQKAALHQVMEVELRVEKEIRIQEVVDEDTVVVCSSANDNRPGRKGWEVGLYKGFRGWKEAEDDDDDDSKDDVRYYHDSEYDRRHEISNNIVPNKSRKYQQGMKIDDHDYDGDNEDPNKSKQQ